MGRFGTPALMRAHLCPAGQPFTGSIVTASPAVKVHNVTTPTPDAPPFAINIGTDSQDIVAWVGGQSKCNFVVVGPVSLLPSTNLFDSEVTSARA